MHLKNQGMSAIIRQGTREPCRARRWPGEEEEGNVGEARACTRMAFSEKVEESVKHCLGFGGDRG